MSKISPVERMANLYINCPFCGAEPGDKCLSSSQQPLAHPHADRWYAARERFFDERQGPNGVEFVPKPLELVRE